jgi:hypothetical protein
LLQGDIQRVDNNKRAELDAAFMLATQIGPILAEGTKGNPRQVKRFLNALLVRQAIAKARGFEDAINQSKLAKLMLAERFQPDFYEHIASQAMTAADGKSVDLQAMEADQRKADPGKADDKAAKHGDEAASPDVSKWLEREWLRRWVKMDPGLGPDDLRPYAFVSRDKRLLASGGEVGGIDALVTRLSSSGMALRMLEPEVKALPPTDAEAAFNALRERAIGAGNFTSPPPGFEGMMIIAKHHARFQSEPLSFIQSVDAQSLGVWVVKGWNEALTDSSAKGQLQTILTGWAQQDKNLVLKKVRQIRARRIPRPHGCRLSGHFETVRSGAVPEWAGVAQHLARGLQGRRPADRRRHRHPVRLLDRCRVADPARDRSAKSG